MNPLFELSHLSASTINNFIERKPAFYASKIKRDPFKTNANMSRGKAVEHVVNLWCSGININSLDQVKKIAVENYDQEMKEYIKINPNYDKYNDDVRDSVGPMAALAYEKYTRELFRHGKPMSQTKININLPETNLPLIGYLDYHYPGIEFSDCKVVGQSKKKLPQAYCISGALYKKATGDPGFFDFFVNNKTPKHVRLPLTDEDYEFGMSYLVAAAKVIEEVQTCEDKHRMFELVMSFPNIDEMYDEIEIRDVAQQFNIKVRPKVTKE